MKARELGADLDVALAHFGSNPGELLTGRLNSGSRVGSQMADNRRMPSVIAVTRLRSRSDTLRDDES